MSASQAIDNEMKTSRREAMRLGLCGAGGMMLADALSSRGLAATKPAAATSHGPPQATLS